MVHKKIPLFTPPKIKIHRPGNLEYQRTDADTIFHYKWSQDDWEAYAPWGEDVILDSGPNLYHLPDQEGVHWEGDLDFGQSAPSNLVKSMGMAQTAVPTTAISYKMNDSEHNPAGPVTVAADESFTFSSTFMMTSENLDPEGTGVVPIFIGNTTGINNAQFGLLYAYPFGLISYLARTFEPHEVLYVLYPNAIRHLRVNRWHRIVNVWDRDSAALPKLLIDHANVPGEIYPDEPSTVALFSDFGELVFGGAIWTNGYPALFGGSAASNMPVYYAETWMSKGIDFTP